MFCYHNNAISLWEPSEVNINFKSVFFISNRMLHKCNELDYLKLYCLPYTHIQTGRLSMIKMQKVMVD